MKGEELPVDSLPSLTIISLLQERRLLKGLIFGISWIQIMMVKSGTPLWKHIKKILTGQHLHRIQFRIITMHFIAIKQCFEELQITGDPDNAEAEKEAIAEWLYNSPYDSRNSGRFPLGEWKKDCRYLLFPV